MVVNLGETVLEAEETLLKREPVSTKYQGVYWLCIRAGLSGRWKYWLWFGVESYHSINVMWLISWLIWWSHDLRIKHKVFWRNKFDLKENKRLLYDLNCWRRTLIIHDDVTCQKHGLVCWCSTFQTLTFYRLIFFFFFFAVGVTAAPRCLWLLSVVQALKQVIFAYVVKKQAWASFIKVPAQ